MFQLFEGNSANEVWSRIADQEFDGVGHYEYASRAGNVLDLGNVCLTIAEPRQRWIRSRRPALNPAFAMAEVVWILNGRRDAAFLNFFNSALPKYAGRGDIYDGAYGYRLRSNLGFDQLERAYQALCGFRHSRQVVLQIWDGTIDFPEPNGLPSSSDVPCNVVSLLKVRNDQLHWTQVMRSNDLFLGLPHNLIQFTTLQEVLAGWLQLDCGEFHLVTDSLHVYECDLPRVRSSSYVETPNNSDRLTAPRSVSEELFRLLASFTERIVDPTIGAAQVVQVVSEAELPTPYQNFLYVLGAEGLRRRAAISRAQDLMSNCTNLCLQAMWDSWIRRVEMPSVVGTIAGK